jgi:hypothetical protein
VAANGVTANVRKTEAGWELRLLDHLSIYNDEEEAVEAARAALRTTGGGTIKLFRRGEIWDEIDVRETSTDSSPSGYEPIPDTGSIGKSPAPELVSLDQAIQFARSRGRQ